MKDKIKHTILSILEEKRADGDVLPCVTSIENNKKRSKNEVKEMDK